MAINMAGAPKATGKTFPGLRLIFGATSSDILEVVMGGEIKLPSLLKRIPTVYEPALTSLTFYSNGRDSPALIAGIYRPFSALQSSRSTCTQMLIKYAKKHVCNYPSRITELTKIPVPRSSAARIRVSALRSAL
jgi:hypothetical protein